jgi:ABC-type iron transport system FetAB permease component
MEVIDLQWWKLALASLLVILLALLAHLGRVGISHSLLVAAVRTVVQLSLIGLVLEALLASSNLLWIGLLALVMLLVAGLGATRNILLDLLPTAEGNLFDDRVSSRRGVCESPFLSPAVWHRYPSVIYQHPS